jgi:hypothetical protein
VPTKPKFSPPRPRYVLNAQTQAKTKPTKSPEPLESPADLAARLIP